MKEAANRGGLRSELAHAAFHFAFFHTFTGVIGPSGVWTLLPVVVMVLSLNVTVCSRTAPSKAGELAPSILAEYFFPVSSTV